MNKIISIATNIIVFCACVAIIVSDVSTYLLTQEIRAEREAKEIHYRSLAKSNLDELIRCHSVGGLVRATEQGEIECSDSIGVTNLETE